MTASAVATARVHEIRGPGAGTLREWWDPRMHATLGVMAGSGVAVRYRVRPNLEAWVLPEGTVPQSIPHDDAAKHLQLVLEEWARRAGRPIRVARELAVRWIETHPRVGIDPDVCVLDPPPDEVRDLSSLCLWKAGHCVPSLCIEVVSQNHPYKDYALLQDRYAAMGTPELIVFDPLLAGPPGLGGPVALQVWRRDELGLFERVHFGDGPAYSETLRAWLIPNDRLLEVADDRSGLSTWPTAEERAERAEAERDREQVARKDVERRLAELEERVRKPN